MLPVALRLGDHAGAPSLTHSGGSIGATDLLLESKGEVIGQQLDMPMSELAAEVRLILVQNTGNPHV